MLKEYIGKTIVLFPGDTYHKEGILLNCDNNGILVKITEAAEKASYIEGKIYFISYNRLIFEIAWHSFKKIV